MTEGVSTLPRDAWNRLVGDESPFLEWEWLASLEETGCVGGRTGWIPRTLAAYDDQQLVAACPLYVKFNSEGEFVYDHGWAHAAERAKRRDKGSRKRGDRNGDFHGTWPLRSSYGAKVD